MIQRLSILAGTNVRKFVLSRSAISNNKFVGSVQRSIEIIRSGSILLNKFSGARNDMKSFHFQ